MHVSVAGVLDGARREKDQLERDFMGFKRLFSNV